MAGTIRRWTDMAFLVLRDLYPEKGPEAVADEIERRYGWRPSKSEVVQKAAHCRIKRKHGNTV